MGRHIPFALEKLLRQVVLPGFPYVRMKSPSLVNAPTPSQNKIVTANSKRFRNMIDAQNAVRTESTPGKKPPNVTSSHLSTVGWDKTKLTSRVLPHIRQATASAGRWIVPADSDFSMSTMVCGRASTGTEL